MGGQRLWKVSSTSVHDAVRRAVTVARDEELIKGYDEPFVTLALLVADQLDSAAADDRPGDVARLVKPMRDLLNDLPRPQEVPDGRPVFTSDDDEDVAGDTDPDAAGPADPVDAELEALMGSGPEVGDAAES